MLHLKMSNKNQIIIKYVLGWIFYLFIYSVIIVYYIIYFLQFSEQILFLGVLDFLNILAFSVYISGFKQNVF